ncbi:hypothetical protein WA026_018646 [Henosepilachna vigintioctopunctata]|uniref:Uncharacterized protein n=1 Tax=Henosepilachna vigintioctopunctata TaxID=420089 RepID=A0AAW1UAA3_9CUCU
MHIFNSNYGIFQSNNCAENNNNQLFLTCAVFDTTKKERRRTTSGSFVTQNETKAYSNSHLWTFEAKVFD